MMKAVTVTVHLTINGSQYAVDGIEPHESLLFVLRERLGLYAAKNACEQGECGSCSVLLDGKPVCACLVMSVQAQGREVVTLEGLRHDDTTIRLQQALVDLGAVQCGFCTPGFVMMGRDLLQRIEDPSLEQIREELSGNLCRCTGYAKIVDAVQSVAHELRLQARAHPRDKANATIEGLLDDRNHG